MNFRLLLVIFLLSAGHAVAQSAHTVDTGTFVLHTFENPVGLETYQFRSDSGKLTFSIFLKARIRGADQSIDASLVLSKIFEPIQFYSKYNDGNTVRKDTISRSGSMSRVRTNDTSFNKKPGINNFFATGYLPITLQQELLVYWLKHGQPAQISLLPQGTVRVKLEGSDSFFIGGKSIKLKRYTVNGLVWGNEFLWADDRDRLIGLITNTETNDKFEAIRKGYDTLLKVMVAKTALYGTAKLAAKPYIVKQQVLTVIKGGTVIDVSNGTLIKNAVIVIEGNHIISTGLSGRVKIPAGAKVIDARGKTIIPGLWDMHAHYGQAEWGPAYLGAGVTTVRDCTDEFEYANPVKKLLDEGKGIGPRILKAGLIDGTGPDAMGIVQVETSSQALVAVRRFAGMGYTQVKIFNKVKPAVLNVICKEAHRLGLTVTGHIPEGMTVQAGIDSGMDMISHVYYLYAAMKHRKDGSINWTDSTTLAAVNFLKEHQVVTDLTIGGMEFALRSKSEDIKLIEPAFETLPLPLKINFAQTGMAPAQAEKYRPMFQSMQKMVKVLHDANVPIVAGSDVGIPGFSLIRELELYVAAGLSPLQALQTATVVPARVMKMSGTSGAIAAGKQADIVILDANPLENISNLRRVFKVFHNGRMFDPKQMHQLAGFAK